MPAASTEQLPDLVRYLEDAGLSVEIDTEGYRRDEVPTHVDMALFTVAREACTNAVRHAHASRMRLRLACDGQAAMLEVADDGRGCGLALPAGDANQAAAELPTAADGEGHGVAGMAERVHVLGGTLAAGDAPEGGFTVRASIPLEQREA